MAGARGRAGGRHASLEIFALGDEFVGESLTKAFFLQGFCYLELSTRRIFAFYFSLEAYS